MRLGLMTSKAHFPFVFVSRARLDSLNRPAPILAKSKTDKPDRHKDGSGHHHPMGYSIAESMSKFGRASARPANVASPGPSVMGAFNFETQPVAFPQIVGQYAVSADPDGEIWPPDLQSDDGTKTRSWHYFLIENITAA